MVCPKCDKVLPTDSTEQLAILPKADKTYTVEHQYWDRFADWWSTKCTAEHFTRLFID